MKRMMSVLLAICIMMSSVVTTFAKDSEQTYLQRFNPELEVIRSGEIDYEDVRLTFMYYDNGDVRVVEYDFSDEIIACSYLSVSQNVIISDLIEDGISTETEIKNIYCTERVPQNITLRASQVYVGTITFAYDDGMSSGTYRTEVSYMQETGRINHNVHDNYQSLASFASAIISMFLCSADAAIAIAKWIMVGFSIATSAVNFVIPDYIVSCAYDQMTYYLRDMSTNKVGSFFGINYTFTGDDGKMKNHVDGSYYPKSTYSSHNQVFAAEIYQTMYPAYIWSVRSW